MGACMRRHTHDAPHHIGTQDVLETIQELSSTPTERGIMMDRFLYLHALRSHHLVAHVPARPLMPLELQPVDPRQEECSVCMELLETDCVMTRCEHYFHRVCLERYEEAARHQHHKEAKCPLCRSSIYTPLAVEASAASGRKISLGPVPQPGALCHFDRNYQFLSLGSFGGQSNMLYLYTSNEDRKTSPAAVMWTLQSSAPITVHLNFRSEEHRECAASWLDGQRWDLSEREGTVSSGIPDGPYSGPVFSKRFEAGTVSLNGSGTWKGTFFVFVEVHQEMITES